MNANSPEWMGYKDLLNKVNYTIINNFWLDLMVCRIPLLITND